MKEIISKEKIKAKFATFTSYSADDVKRVLSKAKEIEKIFSSSSFKDYVEDGKCLISMIKDFFTRKYKLPYKTIAAIVGTLLYILLPTDLIHDYLPGIGFSDDVGILGACLAFVRLDLNEYKIFKASQNSGLVLERVKA